MRGSAGRLLIGLGQSLMQPGPDVVGCVCIAPTLIARDEHAPGRNTHHTGQPNPLPHLSHGFQCARRRNEPLRSRDLSPRTTMRRRNEPLRSRDLFRLRW